MWPPATTSSTLRPSIWITSRAWLYKLYKTGADATPPRFVVDWANSEGLTPLHIASQNGFEAMVNVNRASPHLYLSGEGLLTWSSQLLLDRDADIELPDAEGNTCLH